MPWTGFHYDSTTGTDLDGLRPARSDRCRPRSAGEGEIGLYPLRRGAIPQGQGTAADRGAVNPGLLRRGRQLARRDRGTAGHASMADRLNRGEIWLIGN